MGLFSFFNSKNGNSNGHDVKALEANPLPEIPEDVFIEKDKPAEERVNDRNGSPGAENGIHVLFQFLEKNYESKGYDDALINPDVTHLDQNVHALKNDLERNIRKVRTFYQDFIREIDFHIASRSRSGMIDTVEELSVKKETAMEHIKQVQEIDEEARNSRGVGQGIIISYTRGFKNGLAAISHHSILRKNF